MAINLTESNKSPINWLVTPKPEASKFRDQLDFPTNISESAPEDRLAVRDPRHGIIMKWPSSRDTSICNVLPRKWRKLPPLLSPTVSKSTLISEALLDCLDISSNYLITHFHSISFASIIQNLSYNRNKLKNFFK